MSSTGSHTIQRKAAPIGTPEHRKVCAQALALTSTLSFRGEAPLLLSRP